jgi:hypothetical protein
MLEEKNGKFGLDARLNFGEEYKSAEVLDTKFGNAHQ